MRPIKFGLENEGRLGISVFAGLLTVNMWTSNRIYLCDCPNKGTEIDFINFPTCGYGQFMYYFISRGKQHWGPTPFSLSTLTSNECGFLKNSSPISKGCSFQSPNYVMDQGRITWKRDQVEGAGGPGSDSFHFWRIGKFLRFDEFLRWRKITFLGLCRS